MSIPSQSSPSPLYLIWSNEHNAWWRPESCGYTTFIESAGRYSKDEAEDICSSARSPVSDQIVPPEIMIEESVALRQMGSDPDVEAFEKMIGAKKATQADWAALVKERDMWKDLAQTPDGVKWKTISEMWQNKFELAEKDNAVLRECNSLYRAWVGKHLDKNE